MDIRIADKCRYVNTSLVFESPLLMPLNTLKLVELIKLQYLLDFYLVFITLRGLPSTY